MRSLSWRIKFIMNSYFIKKLSYKKVLKSFTDMLTALPLIWLPRNRLGTCQSCAVRDLLQIKKTYPLPINMAPQWIIHIYYEALIYNLGVYIQSAGQHSQFYIFLLLYNSRKYCLFCSILNRFQARLTVYIFFYCFCFYLW